MPRSFFKQSFGEPFFQNQIYRDEVLIAEMRDLIAADQFRR